MENPNPIPLWGLVLGGGYSRRMGTDKSAIAYHGRPQIQVAYDLLNAYCEKTWVGIRPDQQGTSALQDLPILVDRYPGQGPLAAIVSALEQKPGIAWLVVACDLPFLNAATLQKLVEARDAQRPATAYLSAHDGLPEPLCAIWESHGLSGWQNQVTSGLRCARKGIIASGFKAVDLSQPNALDNINTVAEKSLAFDRLRA